MNILTLDSAARTLIAGLLRDDGTVRAASAESSSHAESLLPMIDSCVSAAGLAPGDLDLIACASGPGSFMGLRIGMATAKGMALALGIPWVGVPTLDIIAGVYSSARAPVVPILDARKGRVYTAIYEGGSALCGVLDIAVKDLLARLVGYPEVLFVGPDADLMEESALERSGFAVAKEAKACAPDYARAHVLSLAALGKRRLAEFGPAQDEEGPLYAREPEIG